MEIRSSVLRSLVALSITACGSDPGPSQVTVDDPVRPVGEEGDVVITLHRSGGGGTLKIPFATSAGTASSDEDFAGTTGVVEWADDDFEDKTIVVSLVDDVTIEPSESFGIAIGKPSNDSSVDRREFEIAIDDDDHPGDSFAVTTTGRLMHFDRAQPGRFTWSIDVTGLAAGEKLVALDMRPSNGKLYGLGSNAKLYTVEPMTGVATLASTLAADPTDTTSPFTALNGGSFGIDFNPITDRLRLTSNAGQNIRIDVDTGAVITDAAITGQTTGYAAIAHNNNIAASCRTRLYAIDPNGGRFVTQSPNEGTTEGAGGLRLTATATAGFDIYTDAMDKDVLYAGLTVGGQTGMYEISRGTGEAKAVRAKVSPLGTDEQMVSFALGTLPATTPVAQELGELFGITATRIVSFNRANPEKVCSSASLVGLEANETVLDLDMRPTGSLYALTKVGNGGRLHRVDPYGGTLSPAVAISVPLNGTTFATDFSPAGLRVVSDAGQSLLVTNLETGAATASASLTAAARSTAYTDSVLGAGTATLYVVDTATDRLRIANEGTLADVGPLGANISELGGVDIDGRNNLGFVASTVGTSTQLHTLDVKTGALSPSLGTIGTTTPLLGLARAVPEVAFLGVTVEGKLIRFDIDDPSKIAIVTDPSRMVPTEFITGLAPSEYLVSVDFSPGPNLYGVTNLGNLYAVNSSIADTTKLGALHADPADTSAPFSTLSGTAFDVDFDPAGGQMRIVNGAQQNLRLSKMSPPMVVTDAPMSVNVVGVAYTNSFLGATSSKLYAIDGATNRLMVESAPGTLMAVGPLGVSGTLAGFDINGGNNGIAIAAVQGAGEAFTRLYRIDLATGAATQIGSGIGGAALRSISVYVR